MPEYDDSNDLENVDSTVNEIDPSELFDYANDVFDSSISGEVGRALRLSAEDTDRGNYMIVHPVLKEVVIPIKIISIIIFVIKFTQFLFVLKELKLINWIQ